MGKRVMDESEERKTEAKVDGQCKAGLDREGTCRLKRRQTGLLATSSLDIKVRNDAEDDCSFASTKSDHLVLINGHRTEAQDWAA